MTLRKGWLNRQFTRVESDVRSWPVSMQREAGFSVREQHLPPRQSANPARDGTQVAPQEGPAKNEG
jgi:hypothetical protein